MNNTASQFPTHYETTSVLLRKILNNLRGHAVNVDYIVAQLDRRSFGGLFIILGAVALLPGLSVFAGLAMIIPGIQMLVGYSVPKLPKIIGQRQLNVIQLKSLGEKTAKAIEWVEQFVKPRWMLMSSKTMHSFIGILVACLSFAVMLPLPFSNLPAALALLFLSVGLLERDGIMISFGIILAILALIISSTIAYYAIDSLLLYLKN